jgi:hypothetical protein
VAIPSVRTTAHTFTAHGSWASLIGFSLRLLNLVSQVLAASVYQIHWYPTFHSHTELLLLLLAKFPASRLHSFEFGICPIRPVITSRCLSAGGIRFLKHPIPAEELTLPCGWATGLAVALDQTSSGLSRSTLLSCDWGGCSLYSGVLVSSYRTSRLPVSIDAILSSLLSILPTT